ncbi:SusD/RagB-like outer membrane lipoprotein [Sphingobacterium allocomposti]|uniref:SusD/RagB-like outer membrane lipoprotein n=1 Tax=Sphingobacterium allocomposti TaxID=415956 RepID=A0A5S5D4P2_9SPHI|nr:SusD/RagB family nutrient-binding outer membrane lipoprotein [Sphingobacterium composti Yoo et al. 2007 non Ten et al. 2007]TYP90126.1 SusD/RagB-like outer membrane lipoprotein [Sphingobacterium composti Yoo et al. 2007 non Ten et al. 2007]
MRKIFNLVLAASLLVTGSCSDSFFDINTNPNRPTDEHITPDFLMSSVVANTVKRTTSTYDFAAHWMGYWARGSSFGPTLPLENYDITSSYETGHWSGVTPNAGWYDILSDNEEMQRKARAQNLDFYVGVAKVIKSIGFMYLVDMYNNVPYTEAFKLVSDGIVAPKYDKGEAIYQDLLLQLDSARMIFANSSLEVPESASTADIVFHGDVQMWRKLVNTQTLRLLIHQSQKVTDPSAHISKIVADGAGFLGAGETAWVNPGYSNDQYKVNPMYVTYVRDHNGNLIDGFNRANNHLLDKYRDNSDIRYQYVFLPATSPIDGVLWDGNYLGQGNEVGKGSTSESIVIGTGLVSSPSDPAWLFTSVESLFLQAEAVQRGWISGNPQTAYERAVRESFMFLGVENGETEAATYLRRPIASWSAAANKLELIINQKYLALPGINNFEPWVDYRRLGYPTDVPLSRNTSIGSRRIPLRMQYPANEFSFNATNVEAEGDINPQTARIWWDVD